MSNKKLLDTHFEDVVSLIIDGKTYREIAESYSVSISTLHEYLSKPERSARVRVALDISADSYADKAEQVLLSAKGNMVEIQRARELASHYRWKASKRNPKTYSDKLDLTAQVEAKVEQVPVIKLPNGEQLQLCLSTK